MRIICTNLQQESNGKCLDVTHDVDRERYQLRMIAVWKDGKREEVVFHNGVQGTRETEGFVQLEPGQRSEDIKEFIIERTPWMRGEIKGIALNPGMRPRSVDSVVKPASPTANNPAASIEKTPAFGPVVERVLSDPDDVRSREEALLLRTGKMFGALDSAAKEEGGRLRALAASEGDLYAEYDDYVAKSWTLVTAGLKLSDVLMQQWDNGTAADLDEALKSPGALQRVEHSGATLYVLPNGLLPLTLAFETRNGERGLLQITELNDNPRGVKIRYKLVEQAPKEQLGSQNDPQQAPGDAAVTVKHYGSGHLSYRGDAQKFNDACRTALKSLSHKIIGDDGSRRYPDYGEGGTSETLGDKRVAQRSYKKTKDESGADYQVTTVYLEGQDPLVMLEHTSKDPYRLINALLAEFSRAGFKVEAAGK